MAGTNFPRTVGLSDFIRHNELVPRMTQVPHPDVPNRLDATPPLGPPLYPTVLETNVAAPNEAGTSLPHQTLSEYRDGLNYLPPLTPLLGYLPPNEAARSSAASPSIHETEQQGTINEFDSELSLNPLHCPGNSERNAAAPSAAEISIREIRNFFTDKELKSLVISPTAYLGATNPSCTAGPSLSQLPQLPLQRNIPQYNSRAQGTAGPSAPRQPRPVLRNGVDPAQLIYAAVPHGNYPPPRGAVPPMRAFPPRVLNGVFAPRVPPEMIGLPLRMAQVQQFDALSDMAVGQSLQSKPSMQGTSPMATEDSNSADVELPDVEPTAHPTIERQENEDMRYKQPSQFWPFTREQVVAIHFCKYAVSKVGWLISDQKVARAMQQKLKDEIRRLWAHWVMCRITRKSFTVGVARFAEEFCMPVRKLCLLSSFAPYYKMNVGVELDQTMDFNW